MTTYSADEFLRILHSEKPIQPRTGGPSVTGWARTQQDGIPTTLPAPDMPFLLFSKDYATWIPIPLAMIESVETLADSPTDGLEPEFVRINFTVPEDSQAVVFAHLLREDSASYIPDEVSMADDHDSALSEALSSMAFRWRPPKIRLPRIPDPRDTWRKNAEKLAWATAARIDAATPGNTCPKNQIRVGLYALAATFAVGAQTPESKFMGFVMTGLAAWLPNEYCKGR